MDEQGRRAELLLAGPRGRAVCLCIAGVSPLTYLTQRGGDDGFFANEDRYDQAVVSGVVEALEAVPADGLRITNKTVTAAVAETAGCAAYWQEPDADDVLLADPQVIQGLRPIASVLAASEATSWWGDPLRLDDQFFVSWLFQAKQTRADPPLLTGAAERRFRWRVHAKQEELEAARERPSDLEARYTGSWWSTPVFSGLVSTTPRLANGTPAQLVFIEDEEGMTQARVARLQPAPDVRIYEITDPPDLVELVSRYPLHTDHARRHDWYRTTGCRGPWLIPDWDTIGSSYDAVHLTVLGYLATAGRAIPVGSHYTMLAGWDPSKTWWLNDVLTQAEEPTTWKQHSSTRWEPVAVDTEA